ncbi:MAG: N-acetylglucosamine-6-phosphate deacetylase [Anaerolineae bacterium]|nr:N-acetylglucosamine-6-phosphate deacetylase [Anaerolineae bacterium]
MIAIRAAHILTPFDHLAPGILTIRDGKIDAVFPDSGQPLEGMEVIDAHGCTLGPGLIDVHTHGIGGLEVVDGAEGRMAGIAEQYARHGVTAFLAGVGGSPQHIHNGIRIARRYHKSAAAAAPHGAELLGIHLEGPFINPARSGAFPLETILAPDAPLLRQYLKMAGGLIRLITLAPELPGALKLIRLARAAGVIVSAGHSQATYEEMMTAVEAGLSHATHTFNAMPALHHRAPGILGAVLADERITAEIIADGIHVHPAVVRLFLRSKTPARSVLISDSIAAAGLPDGDYLFEGLDIRVEEGCARLADGTLAGSISSLEKGLANLVRWGGLTLAQAFQTASTTPADELGVGDRKGRLAPGYDADILCLDSQLNVQWCMARGVRYFPPPHTG